MKTMLLGFLLLGSAWAVADGGSTQTEPAEVELLAAAKHAIQSQDWPAAVKELKVVVQEEPGNADAHNLLAYSFRKQAKPDLPMAFEHYRKALKLNPNHKGAHEYIGEAYLLDHKPAEAAKHLVELQRICGNKTCEEYLDLAKAIAKYKP
jgi:Tfp pilus assembly protein PilF